MSTIIAPVLTGSLPHYVPAADVNSGFRSLSTSMDDRMAPYVLSGPAAFGVVLNGYMERLRPDADPLFNLMVEPKKRELYEDGHVPTIEVLMKATAGWLDEVMGAVKR